MNPAPILRALSRLPASLYQEHCERRPPTVFRGSYLGGSWAPCECTAESPDPRCLVGQALDKLRRAEERRYDDGRRHR